MDAGLWSVVCKTSGLASATVWACANVETPVVSVPIWRVCEVCRWCDQYDMTDTDQRKAY